MTATNSLFSFFICLSISRLSMIPDATGMPLYKVSASLVALHKTSIWCVILGRILKEIWQKCLAMRGWGTLARLLQEHAFELSCKIESIFVCVHIFLQVTALIFMPYSQSSKRVKVHLLCSEISRQWKTIEWKLGYRPSIYVIFTRDTIPLLLVSSPLFCSNSKITLKEDLVRTANRERFQWSLMWGVTMWTMSGENFNVPSQRDQLLSLEVASSAGKSSTHLLPKFGQECSEMCAFS
jgi:hypothetical protein